MPKDIVPNKVKKKQLTPQERRFADQYLIDLNATQAAIRAGYSVGMAKEASRWIKEDNPEKPYLAAYIRAKEAELAKRTGINAERIVQELARIALVNPADVVDLKTGRIRDDAKREDLAAIESICVQTGKIEKYEVKFASKHKALETLAKYKGMLTDKLQVDGAMPVIIDDLPEDDLHE